MATIECLTPLQLDIASLVGHLCTIEAGRDWQLQDLTQAIQLHSGIPWDQQQLLVGASILTGATKKLVELLPDSTTDVMCLRSQEWVLIPVFSGGNARNGDVSWRGRFGKITTVDDAKLMCTDDDDDGEFWGFTFEGNQDAQWWEVAETNGFKKIGQYIGSKRKGVTHVRLSEAGRAVLLKAIRERKGRAKQVIVEAIQDLEVILSAIEHDAGVFRYVHEDLQCNSQVAELAVMRNPFALQHASKSVQEDRAIARMAIEKNSFALQHVSTALRADRELVLLAITQNPSALRYASEGLRADLDLCLFAVRMKGEVLQFVAEGLRNTREIVVAAVRQNGEALCYASCTLRSDPELIAMAWQQSCKAE